MARDAAGLRPLRFHDLRHTYGSLLAAAGIDLVSIQAVMGQRRSLNDEPLPTRAPRIGAGRGLHARIRTRLDVERRCAELARIGAPNAPLALSLRTSA
jgi:hypothetical protein